MKKVLMLTEGEINDDLKRNLVGLGVTLDEIFNKTNKLRPLERKEIIENYSCGYHLREFICDKSYMSYSEREVLPVAFSLAKMPCIYMLYDIVTIQKGVKALNGFEKMNLIEVEWANGYRTTYKVNDYKTIKNGLLKYFLEHEENEKELRKIIDKNLDMLKDSINRISEESSYVHYEFKKWFEKEKKDFKANPYMILRNFIKDKFSKEEEKEILISYNLAKENF